MDDPDVARFADALIEGEPEDAAAYQQLVVVLQREGLLPANVHDLALRHVFRIRKRTVLETLRIPPSIVAAEEARLFDEYAGRLMRRSGVDLQTADS